MRINTETNINPSEIMFLQSSANYTMVHTVSKKYISSRTLKVLATRIDQSDFLKIKRGLIINKTYIQNFNALKDDAFVTLSNGQVLPVSRRLFEFVKAEFG
jgi:two-component system, LytTR family, response regulator